MTLVGEIFEIRSRAAFSANDITLWVVKVLDQFFGIDTTKVKTEVIIKGNSKGRADIVVQDSIGIETKKSMPLEANKAETQVKRILTKLENEGSVSPVGIATDGEEWAFYVLLADELLEFARYKLKSTTTDAEFRDLLWAGLTTLRKEKDRPAPSALQVAEAFRPGGPAFNEARVQLVAQMRRIMKKNPVDFTSKFLPWFELFSYVYNNFDEKCRGLAEGAQGLDEVAAKIKADLPGNSPTTTVKGALELYIRHTYLAMIAKLLATLVTVGEQGVAKELLARPARLLSGEATTSQGVQTADPNDFFVWPTKGDDVGKLAGTILRPLQRFSDEYSDDVFRHLYEAVVDKATRHELGEFFTPKWIGQLVVEEAIQDSHARVLDPACGSGTFLVFALRRKAALLKKEKLKAQDITQLLDEVWGIDVNPLSVILARTNLYLTVVSLIGGGAQPPTVRPRVYVSDTFVLPRFNEAEQRRISETGSASGIIDAPVTPNISVPILRGLDPDQVIKFIELVGQAIDEDDEPDVATLSNKKDVGEYLAALATTMLHLKDEYGNSLWKFVLRNYGVPPLLRKQFDVVVGNPPWLAFREARPSIQITMESLAAQYQVRPRAKFKTSFNLAVAFFLASLAFLKPKGRIGFVFPLSVLDSPAHLPFVKRLRDGPGFKLLEAYDLSGVTPAPFPHDVATAIIIAEVDLK